jgi:hypothetical protein
MPVTPSRSVVDREPVLHAELRGQLACRSVRSSKIGGVGAPNLTTQLNIGKACEQSSAEAHYSINGDQDSAEILRLDLTGGKLLISL